ncbi:MAG: prolipoprotein diacylglyceryl transferase [Bacteroidaceae bacterium]|nr:prolipoprotein diacylglyceryl transferase [Bacteroidaceae bacterium]
MMSYLFINWNPDIVMLQLGPVSLRWYSMCWLFGLLGAFFVVRWLYKEQKIKDELFDPLFFYCFIGILVGARLGHCIFYEPGYFLSSGQHILEMILPMRKFADGSWHFTGYQGLASHGGTAGLIIAILLYSRKTKVPVFTVLDFVSIATPITAGFIRLGNLMNSEIIGKVTDVPWAFVFERVDMMPRHPGQLYEAIAYFILLFIGLAIYRKHKELAGTGYFFGLCILYIFTFRFFIEYTKENQEAFEDGMLFNMGQQLSVPFVILGAYFMWKGVKRGKSSNNKK